ncbi:PaaI family thioesterase [Litorimonas sp. WD9-15]|uniref:PaaI family thioesterase n=1 Tax=Litorimonas sp. WD9-15 TaxID=3418716 RepID=UPI003CFF7200
MSIPEGYKPHFRKSAFTDPWEPLYSRMTPDQISLGAVLREAHCNSRGIIHGGFISSIADNAMGLTCAQMMKAEGREMKSLITVNLSVDFTGMAKVGEWIATQSEMVKLGGSLGFVQCQLVTEKAIVARANATFKLG